MRKQSNIFVYVTMGLASFLVAIIFMFGLVAINPSLADGVSIHSPASPGMSVHANATEVTVGDGAMRKTVLTLANVPMVVAATSGGETNGFGSVKLVDFPEGRILIHSVTVDLSVTVDGNTLDVADGGDLALGTSPAIVTTGGVAHTGVRADLCPNISLDPITNAAQSALAASAQFDGTSSAKDMYCNGLIDYGDIASIATNSINGTVTYTWTHAGDY